jgi:glycosyltransferase involved in cell wall biosynthesis
VRVSLCEVTVLLPIFNKAHYFHFSFASIFNLSIYPSQVRILCYDDASTDKSVSVIKEYQQNYSKITLIEGFPNRGTLYSRIRLVEETQTPWMVFLDPDDEFYGNGLAEGFDLLKQTDVDIVQFGCRLTCPTCRALHPCWREPRRISVLTGANLTKYWLAGRVDAHLHRKIWRTALFQAGVRSITRDIRETRICRCEDGMLWVAVLLQFKGVYRYIATVGEIRHAGWPDNSASLSYQSKEDRKSVV